MPMIEFRAQMTPALPKCKEYKAAIGRIASAEMKGRKPTSNCICLECLFSFPVPKSWPKYRKEAARRDKERHTKKPGLDNLVKAVQDALNGIVYQDDRQIVTINAMKNYTDNEAGIVQVKAFWEDE